MFYSERMEKMWIMTSNEFIAAAVQNKSGKLAGVRSIWFNGRRRNATTRLHEEHVHPRFQRFVATDFRRIAADAKRESSPGDAVLSGDER